MRFLREVSAQEEVRQGEAPGGYGDIPSEEVLQCYLRKLANVTNCQWAAAEKQEASGPMLRSMWANEAIARASRKRRQKKQRPIKSTDALHSLSQLLARDAQSAWTAYRRSDASSALSWDDGLPPLVHGSVSHADTSRRRARVRALGNAVVPQCAETVGYVIRELLGK